MLFNFCISTKIFFGNDCFRDLLERLKNFKFKKIGIVIDQNIHNLDITKELISDIKKLTDVIVAEVTISEPTYRYLEEIRQPFMGGDIQAVIGVGGGSTLDTAKAIAVLVNNKGKALAYRGFDKMTEPVLPIFAVPTTAGTGAEVTPNASFVDDEIKKKLGINGEAIRPEYAFLNPEMLLSCPEKVAVSAGIDSLVHAVEAFAAKKATYVSKIFSKEAVGLIMKNIERAIIDKEFVANENLFLGSLLAGIAMMNSGTGPAAALSYPLGVHKKVPHGFAGGVFLPMMMEWNIKNGYYGYGDFAQFLFDQRQFASQEENARRVLDKFKDVWGKLNVPIELKEYGYSEEDIDKFVNDILELKGALDQNPIKIDEKEIRTFLKAFA